MRRNIRDTNHVMPAKTKYPAAARPAKNPPSLVVIATIIPLTTRNTVISVG